jgi:pimeloyl-ACP methyl ester carboxylesterase
MQIVMKEKPLIKSLFNYFYRRALVMILCCSATIFYSCNFLKLRRSDRYHISTTLKLGYNTEIKYFNIGEQKVRCLITGNPNGTNLLLLHGSPSSLSSWSTLYADSAFMNTFKIIAVDRPGYGYSNFGDVEISITRQAEIVETIIDSLELSTTILLGASYGGPVAAQVAIDRPQRIEHLVFLSASVKPNAEKTFWISHLMTAPVIKYAFPAVFRMSSEEKLSHAKELDKIIHWDSIKSLTSVVHGDKDDLIYFSNAEFLKDKIPNSKLYIMKDKGHSLIFTDPDYLKKMLLAVLLQNDAF